MSAGVGARGAPIEVILLVLERVAINTLNPLSCGVRAPRAVSGTRARPTVPCAHECSVWRCAFSMALAPKWQRATTAFHFAPTGDPGSSQIPLLLRRRPYQVRATTHITSRRHRREPDQNNNRSPIESRGRPPAAPSIRDVRSRRTRGRTEHYPATSATTRKSRL